MRLTGDGDGLTRLDQGLGQLADMVGLEFGKDTVAIYDDGGGRSGETDRQIVPGPAIAPVVTGIVAHIQQNIAVDLFDPLLLSVSEQIDEGLTGEIRGAVKFHHQIAVQGAAIALGLLHGAGGGQQSGLEGPVQPQIETGGGGGQHLLGGGGDHEGVGMDPVDAIAARCLVGDGDARPFRYGQRGMSSGNGTTDAQEQGGEKTHNNLVYRA